MTNENDAPISLNIEESWRSALQNEFDALYFKDIKQKLIAEKRSGIDIYPPGPDMFRTFNTTPFSAVKVVILGQDPYHGKGQAHGLSFSVPDGVTPPPSLANIFKELRSDVGCTSPSSGDLTHWAEQGVLLLNAILTVRAGEPASHRNIGWETFTDATIKKLSDEREHLVFMLWGKFAQEKASLIDANKHLILIAPHPSPYSASSGFFGCKHFSKANAFLEKHSIAPVRW